jgi:hypothetical protein
MLSPLTQIASQIWVARRSALGIAEVIVRRASPAGRMQNAAPSTAWGVAGLVNQLRSTPESVPIRAPSQSANVHAAGGRHLRGRWFRVV